MTITSTKLCDPRIWRVGARARRTCQLTILALILTASAGIAGGQGRTPAAKTPDALVADLYRAHKLKHGPFFQTRSRALVDNYFTKSLADLIWKDARTSKGEVGAIDGDPLYDAQDFEIKHFAVGKAAIDGVNAKVTVTFENIGEKKTIVFLLMKGAAGWRINDIDYGNGRTLVSFFKESR
jgi:uncharacterized protein DUF3828